MNDPQQPHSGKISKETQICKVKSTKFSVEELIISLSFSD